MGVNSVLRPLETMKDAQKRKIQKGFLLRWAKFNDCRGGKKCEKVRKNAKNVCEIAKNSMLLAKNSVVLVNFVSFWGHFTEMKKVRKKNLILAGAGMRFAQEGRKNGYQVTRKSPDKNIPGQAGSGGRINIIKCRVSIVDLNQRLILPPRAQRILSSL